MVMNHMVMLIYHNHTIITIKYHHCDWCRLTGEELEQLLPLYSNKNKNLCIVKLPTTKQVPFSANHRGP